ncbi:hypothetical protein B5V03_37015 [Bradyrhizobium betae]|uniref:Uncharacterized protein n=2 Tax=Bradyrhizobium betae TaxID=244734 RepID=A0A4Q1UPF8_9BRAD|nr:hypothetical protein B5V03_37015 [Bradyrhizobium betae]
MQRLQKMQGSRVPVAIIVKRRRTGTSLASGEFAVKQAHFGRAQSGKMMSDLVFLTRASAA